MATANPLEDLLSTDVDESEISALVGSLQSQLASPTHKDPIHRNLASSALSNHGDERVIGATQHLLSHTTTGTVAKAGLGKNSNELLLNTTNGNKLTTVNQQVLSLNSVMSTNVNPVNSISKVTAGALNQTVLSQNRTGHVINPHGTYTIPSNQIPSSELNAVGSTNIGTINTTLVNSIPNTNHSHSVAATGSSGGSNLNAIYNLASIAAKQQPLQVPRQVSSHGQTLLTVNNPNIRTLQSHNQADIKPEIKVEIKPAGIHDTKPQIGSVSVVNTNGGNTSPYVIKHEMKPQVKQEIRMVSQPMSTNQTSANLVSTGMRVVATNPATSNITIGKSITSQPTVAVVRSVNSSQHGQIQIVNVNAGGVRGAGMVTQSKTNPRMTHPVRIAPQVIQGQGGQGTIVLPQGTNIPPGTMIVKNQHGQLMVVQNPNARNVQHTNTTMQGGIQKIQTITPGINSTSIQKSQTATGIHTIITGSQAQAAQLAGQQVTVRAPVIQTTNAMRTASTIPTVVQSAVEPRIIQGSAPRQMAPGSHVTTAAQNQGMTQQSILDNVRKCKNFLSTLIKLASSQPPDTVKNVRNLIQNLIDGKVEPKDFTDQLQVELKSSPQPYLVPFLKKSLPLLRQSLSLNKMTIDGVRPPPPGVLRHPPPPLIPSGQTTHIGGVHGPKVQYRQVQIRGVSPGQAIRPGQGIRPGVQQQPLQNVIYQQMQTQHGTRIQPANQTKTLLTNPSRLPSMVTTTQSPQREKRKYESLKDDDDINDVATMGGVNLTEESRNILATNSELMSGQLRSCKDENFVYNQPLHSKLLAIAKKHGLDEVPQDVVNIVSHATQERLRTICEKLAVIAEHRVEMYKTEHKYQVTSDVKSQLNFLKELDKIEKKRHDEAEREVLLRAAKSRAKNEDPEQLKLKEKAKAMQLAEMELTRQKEANEAALGALGPSKKRKMEAGGSQSGTNTGGPGSKGTSFRPRTKRVNLRDLVFLMEQERESSKSNMLYKSYLK